MHRPQGHVQYFTLLVLLTSCLIAQVSSFQCYVCNSDNEENCLTDSKVGSYGKECKPPAGFMNKTTSGSAKADVVEYKCVTLKGYAFSNGRQVVDRRCVQKYLTCDTIKYVLASGSQDITSLTEPIQLENCDICDSDKCNSSGHLTAGFLSLLLLAVYLIKF